MKEIVYIYQTTNILYECAMGFSVLTIGVLVFILSYLFFFKRISRKNVTLANRFFTLVSEISICESEKELNQVISQLYVQDMIRTCLLKKRRRSFMIKALMQYHKSINGIAADNIKWLYEKLELKQDALQELLSSRWHKKAFAIQILAEMGQQDCITKIYRYTNHKNYHIRSESQMAVVKLTGFDGLRFLNVINQPITQWQQLCLLQHLVTHINIQEDKIRRWLQSENITVVEFALKLTKAYGLFNIHDTVVTCLSHHYLHIRREAIAVLKEIAQAHTPQILEDHFTKAEKDEQVDILLAMQSIGTIAQLPFLIALLSYTDTKIKTKVTNTIQEIDPGWEEGSIRSQPRLSSNNRMIILV